MSLLSKLLDQIGPFALSSRAQAVNAAPAPLHQTAASAAGTSALMIACPNPTKEDRIRDHYRLRGQFLARQDRWDDLVLEMAKADEARTSTPAAMQVADLLCFGARSDVVAAAEHALIDGAPSRDAPLMEGIEGLELMLSEVPGDAMRAVIVAHAHMDMGWAWRGTGSFEEVPARNLEAFEAHFDRASDILKEFQAHTQTSPLYAAACAALHGRGTAQDGKLADIYEQLIDLNPMNPAPMRALGNYASPKWYGTHQELELEARRTAARTQDHWGAGGYTWVMFDTLAGDAIACANLDADFFIEGLQDILTRMTDQHTVNVLAAFCAHTVGAHRTGYAKADAVRARIAACAHWIVRNHLIELHPLIWAHAAAGFDNGLRVPSPRRFAAAGQQNALRVIATLFQKEIADGRRIIFTAEGPVAEHC